MPVSLGGLDVQKIQQTYEQGLIQRFERRSKEDPKYFDARLSGSSVALVIQTPKELVVGWVGDVRVSLKSLDSKIEDQLLTPVHTPDIEEEK